jgi:hypothetical protein
VDGGLHGLTEKGPRSAGVYTYHHRASHFYERADFPLGLAVEDLRVGRREHLKYPSLTAKGVNRRIGVGGVAVADDRELGYHLVLTELSAQSGVELLELW